jgi:hypothetical protein
MILQAEVCLIPRMRAAWAVDIRSSSTILISSRRVCMDREVHRECIWSIFWLRGIDQWSPSIFYEFIQIFI